MSFDDEFDATAVAALTPAEAERLRARLKMVSPWRVVGWQLVAGTIVAGLAWWWSGRLVVAWSALYGAAAIVVPNALMARGMTRKSAGAVSAAAGFLFWEMLKLGVAVAMLVIAARVVPQISWPALLLAVVVCIKVNWFALLWRGR